MKPVFLILCAFLVCAEATSLWIVGTASIKAGSPVRREQYRQAIEALQKVVLQPAVQRAFTERHVVYVENNGGPSTYLDDFMAEARNRTGPSVTWSVLYSQHNKLNVSNSGLKELRDEFFFVQNTSRLKDSDWVVKLTGRYRINVPSPLIEQVVADRESPGMYDAIYRPGAYHQRDWPLEHYDKEDSVTGLFAMRAKTWRLYAQRFSLGDVDPLTPAEWWLARFIQRNVPRERIQLVAKLGAWIAPGSDTYYEI